MVRLFGLVRLLIFDLCSRWYVYLGWYVYLEGYSRCLGVAGKILGGDALEMLRRCLGDAREMLGRGSGNAQIGTY